MTRPAPMLAASIALLAGAPAARATGESRRFALVAGASEGGSGRISLRYATSDAREIARVLAELGGVARGDVEVLEDPTPAALRAALARVSREAERVRARGGRSELILYYSGHSDEEGLLLGRERLGYQDLRAELDRTPAEVRVAILDSCASGAFTRRKGGVHRPPFLLDASSRPSGHAFLTSSAADEASQESDRLRGSYFTHALVSGLRGAADTNADSRVTLNEAYQFAFQQTLARTESTRAGPQHPTYDIGLVGSGDVVLTDLRLAGAALIIPEALAGRVFVRDGAGLLVAELRKVAGSSVELALPPGTYSVRVMQGQRVEEGSFTVPGRGRVVVELAELAPAEVEDAATRGDVPGQRGSGPRPLRRVAVDVSLVPPLSVNDAVGRPVRNLLVLAALTGTSEEVGGLALAGIGHGAGRLEGAQLAGVAALVRQEVVGAQLAGVFARAGEVKGVQLAPVNVAGSVAGGQIGVVNVGGRVRGLQLGVVNVAEDADLPVGVLNFIREGRQHVEVFATETSAANAMVKLGGRWFHTLLTAGIEPRDREGGTRWTAGWGLGVHLELTRRLSLDVDALSQVVSYGGRDAFDEPGDRILATLRPTLAWQLAPRLALLAGPSVNVFVASDGEHQDVGSVAAWNLGTRKRPVRLFPGLVLGVRI